MLLTMASGSPAVRTPKLACAGPWNLPEGNVDLHSSSAQPTRAHVVVNPNDLPIDRRTELGHARNQLFYRDALLQRVCAFEVLLHELLIDHRDLDAGGSVLLVKEAAVFDQANPVKVLKKVRGHHAKAGQRAHGRIVECGLSYVMVKGMPKPAPKSGKPVIAVAEVTPRDRSGCGREAADNRRRSYPDLWGANRGRGRKNVST